MYIFDQYECTFEDFISVLIVLDYLQPTTKELTKINLFEILMKCYSETHELNRNEIIQSNIDIKYKKYLLNLCIKKHYKFNNTDICISEKNGIFECKDLKKYCEHCGVIINDYCFKNICLEHYEDYIGGHYDELLEYDEYNADLYVNDMLICQVSNGSNVINSIINFIIESLLK